MGEFTYEYFKDINVDDEFFDTLKVDYPGTEHSTGFIEWFNNKAGMNEKALVYRAESRIGAFVYLKDENEPILLRNNSSLPKKRRVKIGTLKISELNRGQRIGEGALGLALWYWQRLKVEEIYVTTFREHQDIINLIERFGFSEVGENQNGEVLYLKNRNDILYSNPYESYPFLNPKFKYAGYIIFEDSYHDSMFPYSKLAKATKAMNAVELDVANGVSKIYVSRASNVKYYVGEPVLVYRKHNGEGKRYKSCVTSICVITNVYRVKEKGRYIIDINDLLSKIGNKSIFDQSDLEQQYNSAYNLNVYEMLYYAYFGEGKNVNYNWLVNNGLWANNNEYPADRKLDIDELKKIMIEGGLDVSNIIID